MKARIEESRSNILENSLGLTLLNLLFYPLAHQKEEGDIAAMKRNRAEVEKGTLEVKLTLQSALKLLDPELIKSAMMKTRVVSKLL